MRIPHTAGFRAFGVRVAAPEAAVATVELYTADGRPVGNDPAAQAERAAALSSGDRALLENYVARASAASGVSFLGRLGTYRYLDMDVTIKEALDAAGAALDAVDAGSPIPPFFLDPLG